MGNFLDVLLADYMYWLAAAVVYMIVGMVWYSSYFFGPMWLKLTKMKVKDMKMDFKVFLSAVFLGIATARVLHFFIDFSGTQTLTEGLFVGFYAWLGFVVTVAYGRVLWRKEPIQLFLIDSGCYLVTYLSMSAVIACAFTG